uniref:Tyrosinase copper-binding domain-containing protein n=1 Tax=Fibrocapsa japonica TaxID=94617 RepID=A0A7S2XVF9_9STRA
MFSKDWFGSYDDETHTLDEGRWGGLLKVQADQWDQPVHNSYGMARAPWNNNKTPLTQRFQELAGESVFSAFAGWPGCENHHLFATTPMTLIDVFHNVASITHGAVHPIMGGSVDVLDSYSALEEFITAEDLVGLRAHAGRAARDLWRVGFTSCPDKCDMDTPVEECICSCGTLEEITEKVHDIELFNMAWTYGAPFLDGSNYTRDEKIRYLKVVCDAAVLIGDQAEAFSPTDVIFWPIHPTVERLMQWNMLHIGLKDEIWLDESSAYWGAFKYGSPQSCIGHGESDLLPWIMNMDDGSSEKSQYTNKEFFSLSDPSKSTYSLPYIYDSFTWDHCVQEGYNFQEKNHNELPA